MRSAALELGARGIRVNAVAPGVVRTPLMAPSSPAPRSSAASSTHTPLGRIAEGADIADVVAFLASDAARWITGATAPRRRRHAACASTRRCCHPHRAKGPHA